MQVCWKRIHPNSDHPLGHFQWYRACRVQGFWLNSVINKVQRFSFVDRKLPSMCPQFNPMKQTLGIYKQRRDKLGSTTVPTLGRRSQSAIRFNPHTLQTWLCADIVQFWPLSLCHATPRERVQGQQFAHVSSRGFACHRQRGQNCADHVLHTTRELK